MITKDGRDTPIEKLTAENYIVPKGEEKDYHAVITILHDPNVWLKEQAAKREQAAKEAAAAKAKADQEKFDAAVAAAVAKALAEQQAKEQEAAKKPGRPAKEKE